MPLRPRLLFIIHRTGLSVGDGALREGTAAGRTSFYPQASRPDGVFLSLPRSVSVCFFFSRVPCRQNPLSRPQFTLSACRHKAALTSRLLSPSSVTRQRGANSAAVVARPESFLVARCPFKKKRGSLQAVLQGGAATGVA